MALVSGRELAKALGVYEGAIRKLKAGRLAGAMKPTAGSISTAPARSMPT